MMIVKTAAKAEAGYLLAAAEFIVFSLVAVGCCVIGVCRFPLTFTSIRYKVELCQPLK